MSFLETTKILALDSFLCVLVVSLDCLSSVSYKLAFLYFFLIKAFLVDTADGNHLFSEFIRIDN